MKVHRYIVKVCESTMDFIHGEYQDQTRLYVPDKAVIGFRNVDEGVDFFSDDPKVLAEGEEATYKFKDDIRYIGFVEISNEVVSSAIASGMLMNEAKKSLQTAVKALNDLMPNS